MTDKKVDEKILSLFESLLNSPMTNRIIGANRANNSAPWESEDLIDSLDANTRAKDFGQILTDLDTVIKRMK